MFGFIYSIVSYLMFAGTFAYLALFTDGVGVARTVDSGGVGSSVVATFCDVGLILLFGLQHSIMARASFKRALKRIIPPAIERATYVLASSLVLVLLMWQWRPLPTVIWHVDHKGAAGVLWAINAIGWVGVPVTTFLIDHFDLVGLKQAFGAFRGVTVRRKGFVTPLLYRYVRHPMMTSLLVGLWVTPHMTVGHLLLALGMTVYIVIGVHYEERSLVEELGASYEQYMVTTPRFLPLKARSIRAARASQPRPGSPARTTTTSRAS